ncbi:hypothetical protein RXV86_14215 [Alisedimentitalea sp. MJ-SS2]|nr:hypothetical protein [Alisedimentitalea sp. MJ-SS2]
MSAVRLMMEAEQRMAPLSETRPTDGGLPPLGDTDPTQSQQFESGPINGTDEDATRIKVLRGFTPSWKQGVFMLFVAVMLVKPWLIPGLVLLTLWIALIAYFSVGPERISELALTFWDRYEKRFPERAERTLAMLQRGADRMDGWLARLPESWTDGIYLPDLGRSGEVGTEDGPDPFDRLAAEREALLGTSNRA